MAEEGKGYEIERERGGEKKGGGKSPFFSEAEAKDTSWRAEDGGGAAEGMGGGGRGADLAAGAEAGRKGFEEEELVAVVEEGGAR